MIKEILTKTAEILDKIDSVMYYPILIIVMALAGIYFTVLTKGVQVRLFGESLKLVSEPPEDKKHVSSLQAMLVSTASRVGTGNIVGVSTANCLGGPGACFRMWLMCIIGAPYVQNAISTVFGSIGPIFITTAMVLFAFTTLLGNLYYVDNALIFLNKKKVPSERFMKIFHFVCAVIVFTGAIIPMNAAWAMADITMGGMTLINLPSCMILGKVAIDTLKDYEKQKKEGKNPVFKGRDIGLKESELEFWK